MKILFPGLLVSASIIVSCTSQPAIIQTPTVIPEPVNTPTPVPITPTPVPQFIDLKSGGFSLSVQPELEFDTDDYSVNISDKHGELLISLNGRDYVASLYTLESFLNTYLAEMSSRGGSFNHGDPYEISIDGVSGIAVDLSGTFLNDPMAGKAVAISPGKDFIIFGLGISNLGTRKDGWTETGSPIFEAIIDSIKFKDEVKQ